MGFCPITHTEITAWAQGMDIKLTPFERKCIRAIDDEYRRHCIEKESKNGKPS